MASEYASFKGIYNGESSSGMTTFVEMLCGIVSIGIVYMLCSQTTWIDSLAETFGIGWGWIAFGGLFILTGVFTELSNILFLSSYEAERRRKFIACPKCQHETKIVKDDLFSESVISERKKDSNNKLKIEHYRVGTRLVTIACQSCDYTKAYELKFKERT